MKWRQAWNVSQAVRSERKALAEASELLKREVATLNSRNDLVTRELQVTREHWRFLDAPSDSAKGTYQSLSHENARSIELMSVEIGKYQVELGELVERIATTPQSKLMQLLPLLQRMHEICRERLQTEIPRRRELTAMREDAAKRLKQLVESETVKPL